LNWGKLNIEFNRFLGLLSFLFYFSGFDVEGDKWR